MRPIPLNFAKLFREEYDEVISYTPASRYFPKTNESIRLAAVAIVIYKENGTLKTILTLRSIYNGHHSGQVSFPGGKFDETDKNLIETARRECYEEIGIHYDEGMYLGNLEKLFIPVSGFLIEPHLFYHENLPQLTKNEREVASLIHMELLELNNPLIKTNRDIHLEDRVIKNTSIFEISGHQVWGATAIILEDLRRIIDTLLKSESRKTK
jgi:8-oxo-dGTP pyrophosphatase MutT (NUDIX family)